MVLVTKLTNVVHLSNLTMGQEVREIVDDNVVVEILDNLLLVHINIYLLY